MLLLFATPLRGGMAFRERFNRGKSWLFASAGLSFGTVP